ncbi:MAG: NUDIX domain-containing protein [Acholeplasma sp.]|nr:NUDIX domain-containing protein [Acholeplasma sp.]
MIYEYSCGSVVFRNIDGKTKYLVIKQKHGNHYGFPKGHVEENETKIETAMREVFEETGIKIDIADKKCFVAINYSPFPNVMKEVTYFLGEALNNSIVIQECEIDEVYWLDEEEVLNILTFENDKNVFMKLKECKTNK